MGLSDHLRELGFRVGRLKTGTCPRLDGRTIDYSRLEVQPGDEPPPPFSFRTARIEQTQLPCHLTYTNAGTHEVIRANIGRSPMYSGTIQSRGPRYCPSVEDKVMRFADKERHQIFLEPEGRNTWEYYCNGISTSLPNDVQAEMLRIHTARRLSERFEEVFLTVFRDADTSIADAAVQPNLGIGLFGFGHAHDDFSALGKLHRVAHELGQHLA